MSYDGRAVANYILDLCAQKKRPLTNLALQKILYFCHVWTLIEFDRPLVKQDFEAWPFGPVLQHVYREFKGFEKQAIDRRALKVDPETGQKVVVGYNFDADLADFLPRVVDFYSQMRAGDLVDLSHVVGGPWDRVWNHSAPINPGMLIDNKLILDFYSKCSRSFSIQ